MHFLLVREFAWCCRKSRDRKIKHGNRQQTAISVLFHKDVWLLLTRNHKYRRRKLIGVNLDSRREVLTTKADNANLRLCITYDQCQKPQTNLSRCCYCNFFSSHKYSNVWIVERFEFVIVTAGECPKWRLYVFEIKYEISS